MSDLEHCVSHLEKDVSSIKEDVREIRKDIMNLRVELHQSLNSQTKWMVGFMAGIAVVTLTIARFLFQAGLYQQIKARACRLSPCPDSREGRNPVVETRHSRCAGMTTTGRPRNLASAKSGCH